MASAAKGLRRLPLSYDESDFENSARNIVYEINPHWRTDPGPVVIKRFTEGIMNTVGNYKRPKSYANLDASCSKSQKRRLDVQTSKMTMMLCFCDRMVGIQTL